MNLSRLACLVGSASTLVLGCGSDPVEPINPPALQVAVVWEQPFPPAIVTEIRGFASDDVYAVGGGGMILHHDGKGWTTIDSPTRAWLSSMWRVDNQLVAVGGHGTILRFSGGAWQTEVSNTTQNLRSVWGSASDTLYAVGDQGTVLRYDGQQWNLLGAPPSPWLTCNWGTAADNMYVGAVDSLYHFNGHNWTNTNIHLRDSVWSIWGSSRNNIWVSDGTNWLWHYDGHDWTTVIPHVNYPFTNLWGLAADDVFGTGTGGFVSHFDGVTWSEQSLGDYFFLSQWGTAGNDLWVGGYTGTSTLAGVLFHFDGTEWTQSGELLTNRLRDIWSNSNGDRAIAVGSDGTILEKQNNAWQVVDPITSENLNAVWGAPNGAAVAVGDKGTCLKRVGQVWAPVDLGTTTNFMDVWGSSSTDIYLAAGDGLWHFDGTSRTRRGAIDRGHALWGAGDSNVFVAGTDSIYAVVQHFDGATWKTIYSNEGTYVSQLTGYAKGGVFGVFHDGGLQPAHLRKYDGHEWTDVTPPQVNHFNTIAACENFGLVAVGYNLESGGAVVDESVVRLRDGEWKPLDTKYSAQFAGAWGLDGGVYLVGGASIVRVHY